MQKESLVMKNMKMFVKVSEKSPEVLLTSFWITIFIKTKLNSSDEGSYLCKKKTKWML